MSMFQKSVINKYLANLDEKKVEKAYKAFRKNYTPVKIEKIRKLKEEEYQDGFLRDLFVDALGYALNPDDNYNLLREFKNQSDSKKADGAILKDDKAIAVIELKSTKTKDLTSVTQQAFNYKNNQPGCKYVITSNFQKLRFYIDYADEHEEFDLFHLSREDFELLYLVLSKDSVFADIPLKLKDESIFHEENVSKQLYKDYSVFKNKLFENLVKNNSNYDKLILFKKSQKLIDRFLFILFAEDRGLLPPNLINRIITRFDVLKDEDNYKPLYDIYNQFFDYLNFGRKGKTSADDIPAYNGGLFYPDGILDDLKIDDSALIDDLRKLSTYDFNSEVDVNILGHIFEHSLSEIEEITAKLEGITADKTKSKRKKDGVFYTPKYITQYIVENTIGTLCKEKRAELDIVEIEFDGSFRLKKGKLSVKGQKLYNTLEEYKKWLFSLKIVDPACGSGAFLNQALNFLIEEHNIIDDITAELTNMPLRLFDVDKAILENNLYGVDINEESIEIAKLSLWLHTAQKGRKLSVLSNNIKCGNSLIDDPKVAGDKAFNWQEEFPKVFAKGGFDVVIGNPPYAGRGSSVNETEKAYIRKTYKCYEGKFELYQLFIEKCNNILKLNNSYLSLITPQTWLSIIQATKLRKSIIQKKELNEIVFLGKDVFEDASVDSIIFLVKKDCPADKIIFLQSDNLLNKKIDITFLKYEDIDKSSYVVPINSNSCFTTVINKIKNNTKPLESIGVWSDGIKVVGEAKDFAFQRVKFSDSFHPMIIGKDIGKNNLDWSGLYCCRDKDIIEKHNATDIRLREELMFKREKILIRKTGNEIVATIDTANFYYEQSLFSYSASNKNISNLFILAVLNSKLANFLLKTNAFSKKDTFPQIRLHWLKDFPIKLTNNQEPFIQKNNAILDLNQQLRAKKSKFLNRVRDNFEFEKITKKLDSFYNFDFKTFVGELKKQKIKLSLLEQDEWEEYFTAYKSEINKLQSEISTTDKTIDQMVYKLYDLTDDEIKIVENSC